MCFFKRYDDLIRQAELIDPKNTAEEAVLRASALVDREKTWFWRWQEPAYSRVMAQQAKMDVVLVKYREIEAKRFALISEAKSLLGRWV